MLQDSASQIVETIWPLSVVALRSDSSLGCKGVLPLRHFIQETLRRSRTSYSTLQVALYYLIKIRPHVPNHDFTMEQPCDRSVPRAMQCGRRMFLAALILASKYLQDRNYSARAWSKISGLKTCEINQIEMMFLQAVGWKLHVPEAIYHRWTDIVLKYTPGPATSHPSEECWRTVVPKLTPDLDTVQVDVPSPRSSVGLDMLVDLPSPQRCSEWDASGAPPAVSSEQKPACPRNPPLVLEPTRVESSNLVLPTLQKLGLLPTPQLTPQSSAVSTPAASTGSICSRRPSIGTAMSQAQNLCMARLALDPRPCSKPGSTDGIPNLARRSSLARSTSSASSPDSMISDVSTISSRSSRSSSISSCASATCAPSRLRMAVAVTRRCAAKSLKESRKNLVIQSPIDEMSLTGIYQSPEGDAGACGSVPDLSNFSIHTPVDMTAHEAAQGLCELSGAMPPVQPAPAKISETTRCRKRGRPLSEDQALQSNVREMMTTGHDQHTVLPDSQMASSFLLPEAKNLQVPLGCGMNSMKLPVPVPNGGIKRACCSAEVRSRLVRPGAQSAYADQ